MSDCGSIDSAGWEAWLVEHFAGMFNRIGGCDIYDGDEYKLF